WRCGLPHVDAYEPCARAHQLLARSPDRRHRGARTALHDDEVTQASAGRRGGLLEEALEAVRLRVRAALVPPGIAEHQDRGTSDCTARRASRERLTRAHRLGIDDDVESRGVGEPPALRG